MTKKTKNNHSTRAQPCCSWRENSYANCTWKAGNLEILRSQETRILINTGSQRTYISKELADNLQLKTRETQEYSVYTFGNKKLKRKQAKKDYNITSRINDQNSKRK